MSSMPRLVLLGGCTVANRCPGGTVRVTTQWYMPTSAKLVSEKYSLPLKDMNRYLLRSVLRKLAPGPLNHWKLASEENGNRRSSYFDGNLKYFI